MGDEGFLTTAEVARRLGVKAETVYAYASRGLLTSVRRPGRRGSLFAAEEVDRLAGRGREPGVVEGIRTRLTRITDDEVYFRGQRAADLAGEWGLESVAHFLWTGELADRPGFPVSSDDVELVRSATSALPGTARLTDHLRVAVAVLGAADPLRFDLAPEAVRPAAERLIGVLADALPGRTTHGTLGERLWPKLTSRRPEPRVLDAALVLLADHGLAVSTVAARVAASARANLYAVVSAGLGAMDGHYHGGASTLAYRFLSEARENPVEALSERLRATGGIPGFGHRIYQRRDPRADALFALLPENPVVGLLRDQLSGRPDLFPNVDLALAAMMHTYDMRPDAGEAVFAIARTAGWVAHALEEYHEPGLRFRVLT
ncbi:citrate/2-methylcitrate synthase [Amycolatopsis thermophila]|uniref:citrate synthase (unknown stereospecificity) n=1 Tax=Amycolatopsis thermophila TaxID=206084 RepID=A0ABU0EP69_9PSEU|nr:citrate/2-methylcitrate synthase [Amycolatopsis thermophila]MDQ0377042.1 citrate synthase [Amycolatopsis thermophila]